MFGQKKDHIFQQLQAIPQKFHLLHLQTSLRDCAGEGCCMLLRLKHATQSTLACCIVL